MRTLDDLRHEFGSMERGPLGLDEYQRCAVKTYRGPAGGSEKLNFLLLGLFGEVGSLLSELKKKQRDRSAYVAYGSSSHEETGDVLWYLANVVDHCGLALSDCVKKPSGDFLGSIRWFEDFQPQAELFQEPATASHVQASLLMLAESVGALLPRSRRGEPIAHDLAGILAWLVSASNDAQVNLAAAAQANLEKLMSRWPLQPTPEPRLDVDYPLSEQFPRCVKVRFEERDEAGRKSVVQSIDGIRIGDPLTDNSTQIDDYRFHDIFHWAYAAILGWSPVTRSLLRVRRVSRPDVNEAQDGARAKITEEGISNWIFSHGLRHEAFEHVGGLDFALLKTIKHMVKGYEVEGRAYWMWERAILEGFRVFRLLRAHRGGYVTVDFDSMSLCFVPLTCFSGRHQAPSVQCLED